MNPLSRVPKNWEDRPKTDAGSYDNIVAPNASDCNALASTVITLLHHIMIAHNEGIFPTVEQAKDSLKAEKYKTSDPLTWRCDAYTGDRMIIDIADGEYCVENTIYDLPEKMDLNKKDTVLEILQYCIDQVVTYFLGREDNVADIFTDEDPYLSQGPIEASGDGSPIDAALKLLSGVGLGSNERKDPASIWRFSSYARNL